MHDLVEFRSERRGAGYFAPWHLHVHVVHGLYPCACACAACACACAACRRADQSDSVHPPLSPPLSSVCRAAAPPAVCVGVVSLCAGSRLDRCHGGGRRCVARPPLQLSSRPPRAPLADRLTCAPLLRTQQYGGGVYVYRGSVSFIGCAISWNGATVSDAALTAPHASMCMTCMCAPLHSLRVEVYLSMDLPAR